METPTTTQNRSISTASEKEASPPERKTTHSRLMRYRARTGGKTKIQNRNAIQNTDIGMKTNKIILDKSILNREYGRQTRK